MTDVVTRPAEEDAQGSPAADGIMPDRLVGVGEGRTLREHAARGAIVNSSFQIGFAGLGLLRQFLMAAFLTRTQFGVWGLILVTVMTLAGLKQLGIADKYIQQSEPDQEAAYQKAFTLELIVSVAFFALVIVALPIYAAAYGKSQIIIPAIIFAAQIPVSAFETPQWIAYRRMQFVRSRVLTGVDAVSTSIITIVLAVAGFGYWALVIGALAGSVLGAIAATVTSPYRPKLRFERGTAREYFNFSWPLVGYQLSNLVMIQGVMLVATRTVGLAGVGAIGLASSISTFANRVDGIVSQTIYPMVCAVANRIELLHEAFIKSNRIALMWGMPFGVGLALFAHDLTRFGFGPHWEPVAWLLGLWGLYAAFRQVAFNWEIFMRAVNNTKPLFWNSLIILATFFLLMIPMLFVLGLKGYAIANAIGVVIALSARGFFLRRLFQGFRITRHLVRAIVPSLPPAALVLLARVVIGGDRTAARAIAELVVYAVATVLATLYFERGLLRELSRYIRPQRAARPSET